MSDLSVIVSQPDSAEINKAAAAALALVESFDVVDAATYEIAGDELKSIKAKAASLDERRKAITKPLDEAKKSIMDLFRGPVELLGKAEGILKGKMIAFQQEQDRKAAEARQAAERAAQAERDRLAKEAADLEAQGRAGEAMVKAQFAAMVVAPAPAVAAPVKIAGVATTKTIDFEVVDLVALVQHIAAHPDLIGLVAADSVKIRAFVRSLGLACELPGVRVFEKTGLSASRK